MSESTEYSLSSPSGLLRYAEVQWFYARQMQQLDLGKADSWAATFTEDAVFDVPTLPAPVRGRSALAAAVEGAHARLAEAGEQHRHVMGMIDVVERSDGSLDVRSYTTVYASTVGGTSRVHRVCVCEDLLVRVDGELRVARRRVTRDDLA
ncbi:nuclear transport factor 2 family protein [Streptomyces sp. NPDC053750]|uniref:nuclear transport factor 2 family protein n=1 Tax=Streptomyces sp. NPDC053750 TaxID=3365714 RepID=UPI0037D2AE14